MSTVLRKHYSSLFPTITINWRIKTVAADTLIQQLFDTAQIIIGTESTVKDVYDMKIN